MGDYPVKNERIQIPERERAQIAEEDRRSASRNMLVASAEAEELTHGVSLSARTSDISVHGCYLDTLNPFSPGTRIRVHLTKGNETFHSLAIVTYAHEGMGMGIAFTEISQQAREMIQKWIADVDSGTELTAYSSSEQNSVREIFSDKPTTCCMERLLQILVKKGVLTQEEVREILS
jgi:hypothetical protein